MKVTLRIYQLAFLILGVFIVVPISRHSTKYPALILAVGILWVFVRGYLLNRRHDSLSGPAPLAADRAAPCGKFSTWGGFVLVGLGLAWLEWHAPYYFTQDDNFTQFLPVILQAAGSFFDGVFPSWNPYQGMGIPTASGALYSLTYPPTYLSFAIAKYGLGNQNLTLEIFCSLHLALSYFVLRKYLAKDWGVANGLAVAAAINFLFAGFFLIGGRSWYYMIPLTLWIPVTFQAWHWLVTAPSRKTCLYLGIALGCFFHAGNAQMWIYGLCFFGVASLVLWISGLGTRRHLYALTGAMGIAVVVSAPLLIPLQSFIQDVPRFPWGAGILDGILALFLPYPLTTAPHPNTWGSESSLMTEFYFVGPLFVLASVGLVLTYGYRLFNDEPKRGGAANGRAQILVQFLWLALICFALSLGGEGYLGRVVAKVPPFNKFTNPFKFLAYLAFFFTVLGVWQLTCLLRTSRHRAISSAFVAGLIVVLTALHLYNAQASFFTFSDRPYPVPAAELLERLRAPQRIATVAPHRSARPGYPLSLPHNIASVFRLLHLNAYDPLAMAKPESQFDLTSDHWKEYGVGWLLVDPELRSEENTRVAGKRLKEIFRSPEVIAYEVTGSRPLVFSDGEKGSWNDLQLRGDGIHLRVTSAARADYTVNFLWRPGFRGFLDGTALSLAPDVLRRITFSAPEGNHQVDLIYEPAWRFGYLLVAILSILMLWTVGNSLSEKGGAGWFPC